MNNKILTTFQAAEFCSMSFMTIKRWIHSGKLPAFKTPGGHHRILGKDLIAFMQENNIPLSQDAPPIRKKILIVDDEEPIRNAIKHYLADQNFEVATAEDGFEAGITVTQFKPDLIILDLMMPKMDGFKVLERIKHNPVMQHIRLLVLTGFGTDENILMAYNCGANSVLTKPIEMKKLLDEINLLV
jgi:excisionase family DNA binding protein